MVRLVGCIGWLLVAISALFVVVAVGDLLDGGDRGDIRPQINLGIAAFFIVVGYFGFRLATSKPPGPQALSREQQILALAHRANGKLTLAEAVLHSRMSVTEVKGVLKDLVRQGLAELHLTEGGEEVYAFSGLVPEEKESAKDPFVES